MNRRSFTALAMVAATIAAFAFLVTRGDNRAVGAAGGVERASGPGLSLPPQPAPPAPTTPPFAATSFWNAPLAADAPLAKGQDKLLGEMRRQVNKYTPWINTTEHSTPVYTVPAGQPRVHVHLDTPSALYTDASGARLVAARLTAVPIPPDAHGSADVNHHLVIWQPSSDTIWELWNAHLAERDGCP
jgi:hypothetical protein